MSSSVAEIYGLVDAIHTVDRKDCTGTDPRLEHVDSALSRADEPKKARVGKQLGTLATELHLRCSLIIVTLHFTKNLYYSVTFHFEYLDRHDDQGIGSCCRSCELPGRWCPGSGRLWCVRVAFRNRLDKVFKEGLKVSWFPSNCF